VCGTAASTGEALLVPDVEAFPGHIACDGASRSEVVVPIKVGGKVVGVVDVDCAVPGGFDEVDRRQLERLAEVLAEGSDW
jgi:L-methionine (R)-S-oxide reductase